MEKMEFHKVAKQKKQFGNMNEEIIWKRIETVRAKIVSCLKNERMTPEEKMKTIKHIKHCFMGDIFFELLVNDKDVYPLFLEIARKVKI